MKKYKKQSSSPLVLLIPLVIAVAVIVTAAVLSKNKTDMRSKASFNPTQRCVTSCDNRFVVNPAACKLDCPKVVAGTMTCNAFCTENVKNVRRTTNTNKKDSEKMISSVNVCKQGCAVWTEDVCGTGVTGMCLGTQTFAGTCTSACTSVKSDTKTCDQAFVPSAFAGMPADLLALLNGRCKGLFE